MPARLILIGFCLLLGACAAPWQRDDGRFGPRPGDGSEFRGQSQQSESWSSAGDELLQPIAGARYSRRQIIRLDEGDVFADPMTIDELMQYALNHHPLLRVYQQDIEIAKARLVGAGVRPNPDFVLDSDHNVDDDTFDLSFRLDIPILTAGKIWHREQVAAAGVTRARLALNRDTKLLLSRIGGAAVDVLYYKQLAQLYQRLGQLTSKAAAWQKIRVDNGDDRALDGFVLQADAAEIEQERLKALRQLKAAQMILAQAIGVANPHPVQVEGRLVEEWLPDISLEAVLNEVSFTGPELAAQQAALDVRRARVELEYANAIPDMEIGPRFSRRFTGRQGSEGLRIRIPWVISDLNLGPILESEAARVRAEAMLDAVNLETLGSVATAYAELAPLRTQLEDYTKNVKPLLDQTEQDVNKAIDNKTVVPRDLNAPIRRLVRLRLDHLQARYRYAQLHMRLVAAAPSAITARRESGGSE